MLVFPRYLEDLQTVGIEVAYPPYYRSVAEYLEQDGREFDLVIICRADVASRHMATVRRLAPQARIVFDTVDLQFLREGRLAQIQQNRTLEAGVAGRKDQELRLARMADLTLVVSTVEKAILDEECHDEIDVRIMTNMIPAVEGDRRCFSDRGSLVFIGSFDHAPNVDAVLYFAREILPRVRERIPEAVFEVIGPHPPNEITEIASEWVRILGYVPDVKPIFDRARVAVAPLRFGAGVKGKVNQSMSLGVPTVVTSIAAEGMYLIHERNAMIADDPDSFASAVVRLWTSRELWERISTNGLRNVREHFSVEAAAKPIDELLAWAGLPVSCEANSENSGLAASMANAENATT
jgi:glycosyltransferase involved in cell wall biosynthesis